MFGEGKGVTALLLVMVASRFTLAFIGYFYKDLAMHLYGFDFDAKHPVNYFVDLWASRDMIVSLAVLAARRDYLAPMFLICIGIDLSDILSALLSGASGSLDRAHVIAQLWTISLPALFPESIALYLIRLRLRQGVSGIR